MILLVINAAGAVRNTEERKNSRKIQRENKRQNSKIREKIENVKNNIGKNITRVFKYCNAFWLVGYFINTDWPNSNASPGKSHFENLFQKISWKKSPKNQPQNQAIPTEKLTMIWNLMLQLIGITDNKILKKSISLSIWCSYADFWLARGQRPRLWLVRGHRPLL